MQTGRGTAAKGPYPGEALALPQGGVVTGLADSGGGRLALEGRGGLQGAGGLPSVADFRELYAAALQNGFVQPGTMRDWRAEVEVPALYWEFLQNLHGVQGAQSAVPLLPEWSGGGWEGPVEIEGSALVPMFQDAVPSVQSGIELITPVENPVESDIIKSNGEKEKAANYTSIERTWRLGQTSRDQVQKTLEDFASSFSRSEKEHGITITKEGEVFLLTGTSVTIDHSVIGAESLRGSVGVHNHPVRDGFLANGTVAIGGTSHGFCAWHISSLSATQTY